MISKGDFDILICARDDMANGLDDDIVNGLKSLGLQEDLVGKIRYSYAAVITEDEVKEELNQERCVLRGRLKNDQMYLVRSAGYKSGDLLSVARRYIGYNEKDGSYLRFTNGRREAWCADFVSYFLEKFIISDAILFAILSSNAR